MYIPGEKITCSELDNGLKIVTVEMPTFYTISAGLFCRVGARFERPDQMGISHFIEHLLFKGSLHYTASQISETIEGRGGLLNAYTEEESTCFHFKTLPGSFFDSLEVLIDLFTEPLFDKEEIEREKAVVIEELHAYDDQPHAYIEDLFGSLIWQNHPLGNFVLGVKENVIKYSQDSIQEYFKRHYTAPNSVLAVGGRITHEEVMAFMKKHENRFHFGPKNHWQPFHTTQKSIQTTLLHKETEQCHVQVGFPTPSKYCKEQWALRVLNIIAGENMSSRLFQEIRERLGLAYHIISHMDFYEDVGCFSFQCGVDAERVMTCIHESMKVLKKIAHHTISKDELERAKTFAISQTLQEMESTLAYMLFVGDKLLGQERELSTHYFCKKIQEVTPEEVRQAAEQTFQNFLLNIAIIGPYNQLGKLKDKLK